MSKVLDMDRSGATISFDYFRSLVNSVYSRMDISEKDNANVGADLVPENELGLDVFSNTLKMVICGDGNLQIAKLLAVGLKI